MIKIRWDGIDEEYAHVTVITEDSITAICFELDGEENEAVLDDGE